MASGRGSGRVPALARSNRQPACRTNNLPKTGEHGDRTSANRLITSAVSSVRHWKPKPKASPPAPPSIDAARSSRASSSAAPGWRTEPPERCTAALSVARPTLSGGEARWPPRIRMEPRTTGSSWSCSAVWQRACWGCCYTSAAVARTVKLWTPRTEQHQQHRRRAGTSHQPATHLQQEDAQPVFKRQLLVLGQAERRQRREGRGQRRQVGCKGARRERCGWLRRLLRLLPCRQHGAGGGERCWWLAGAQQRLSCQQAGRSASCKAPPPVVVRRRRRRWPLLLLHTAAARQTSAARPPAMLPGRRAAQVQLCVEKGLWLGDQHC